MRHTLRALSCLLTTILFQSVVFATVPAPTDVHVTTVNGPGGQYFHITFTKPAVPTDSASRYSYQIMRWMGAPPDTTQHMNLVIVPHGAGGTGSYDDHGVRPPSGPADSLGSFEYSYVVYTIHRAADSTGTSEHSAWSDVVVGTLDSAPPFVPPTRDTLVIYQRDSIAANFVPVGAITYIGLFPEHPDSSEGPEYRTLIADSGGVVVVILDSGRYRLRMHAEGFVAKWIKDNNGNLVIGRSGPIDVNFQRALRHAIRGTVTAGGDSALQGVPVSAYRRWGAGTSSVNLLAIDSTDASGRYAHDCAEGDSILRTDHIVLSATTPAALGGETQWYRGAASQPAATPILHTRDRDSIDFNFSPVAEGTRRITLRIVDAHGTPLAVPTAVTVWHLIAPRHVEGDGRIISPPATSRTFDVVFGRYLFYASPFVGTGYLQGYYKSGLAFAPTWSDADTVTIDSTSMTDFPIVIVRDSAIVDTTHGSRIDGTVSDSTGPRRSAHVLLYHVVSAPAGSPVSTQLISSTETDSLGRYAFLHVPAGTYTISIDVVGEASYDVTAVVDASGTPVHKDISYGSSGVEEQAGVIPGVAMLAQNYPNPFSSSTTIAFAIASRGAVDLSIYDVNGRLIETLYRGELTRGTYRTGLRSTLRAGVYHCVLRSADGVATKMITVVK